MPGPIAGARAGITKHSRALAHARMIANIDDSADTRNELGDRATVAIGRASFAIAWDARRGGYNVSRLYGRLRINERPHGRARAVARFVTTSIPSQTYGTPIRRGTFADSFYPWDANASDAWHPERVRIAHAARIVAEREAHGGTYVAHTCPRTPRERDDSGCRCIGGGGAKHRAHGWDTPRDERTDVTRTCDARGNRITSAQDRDAHAAQRYAWGIAFDARTRAREGM